MKQRILILAVAALVSLAAGTAHAACTAEYKAKRDRPFKLIYNVAAIEAPCTRASARAQLSARLSARGLTLLKVLSVSKQ
ncbi:hypothetical protein D6850_11885 [Roseovarius spongiae]|uniref:Uncharacterized protein n=1 Tax=Roseovarius spongiae TaxID=2320272 RepID=A0A3A8B8L5_9RHOB|nr:hypothetical protein [Roseovarius spongiae]RKF13886.1 hypothetical protein D6850_11885 [Roseovarius spongiae]